MLDIGDDLQVQFFGPAQIDGDFDEAEAGRYALSFVPPKAGHYEVHVMLQSVHVPGARAPRSTPAHPHASHSPHRQPLQARGVGQVTRDESGESVRLYIYTNIFLSTAPIVQMAECRYRGSRLLQEVGLRAVLVGGALVANGCDTVSQVSLGDACASRRGTHIARGQRTGCRAWPRP